MSRSSLILSAPPKAPAAGPAPFAPACAVFRRYLHGRGLKFTPERAMILDAVLRREGLFSADQLCDDLRSADRRASRATVYRTLTHLHDAGLLKQVFFDNKQSYFEVLASGQSNDYMISVETGRVIEFQSDRLRELIEELCREHGCERASHQLQVYVIEKRR